MEPGVESRGTATDPASSQRQESLVSSKSWFYVAKDPGAPSLAHNRARRSVTMDYRCGEERVQTLQTAQEQLPPIDFPRLFTADIRGEKISTHRQAFRA